MRALCDGHFGVFADGVLLLSPPVDPAHVADLRIFNPDGSEAELSGNGAREAILYLRRRGWTERGQLHDQHRRRRDPPDDHRAGHAAGWTWGARACLGGLPARAARTGAARWRRTGGVALSPRLDRQPPVRDPRDSLEELMALDLAAIGPQIEGDSQFPNRTNVSWYTELKAQDELAAAVQPRRIRARIFERGVGETLSSGTGASGAAVAHVLEQSVRARRCATRRAWRSTAASWRSRWGRICA